MVGLQAACCEAKSPRAVSDLTQSAAEATAVQALQGPRRNCQKDGAPPRPPLLASPPSAQPHGADLLLRQQQRVGVLVFVAARRQEQPHAQRGACGAQPKGWGGLWVGASTARARPAHPAGHA